MEETSVYQGGFSLGMLNHRMCCAVLSHSVMSESLRPLGLQPTRLLHPWRFSRQEYRSGLPCPPPGDLPNPGIKPRSPTLQADSLPPGPQKKPKNPGGCVAYPFSSRFPDSGTEPGSLALQADSLPTELSGMPIYIFGMPEGQGFLKG